ncbi:hypothetical protein Tco_0956752 [Tanacetum coccineum]
MDNPNITMEEYIRLEEEKARRHAIRLNDKLTCEAPLSFEPTVLKPQDYASTRNPALIPIRNLENLPSKS